jgi:hypothetical protein
VCHVPEEFIFQLPELFCRATCASVVLTPSSDEAIEGLYLGCQGITSGLWAEDAAHFMPRSFHGVLGYVHLGHHFARFPYGSYDPISQEFEAFGDVGNFSLFF